MIHKGTSESPVKVFALSILTAVLMGFVVWLPRDRRERLREERQTQSDMAVNIWTNERGDKRQTQGIKNFVLGHLR